MGTVPIQATANESPLGEKRVQRAKIGVWATQSPILLEHNCGDSCFYNFIAVTCQEISITADRWKSHSIALK